VERERRLARAGGPAEMNRKTGTQVAERAVTQIVYGRRLHTICLFVFRADGLPWPTRGLERMGNAQAHATVSRGFNVLLWQAGGLGYALVSDLDGRELRVLGTRLASGS